MPVVPDTQDAEAGGSLKFKNSRQPRNMATPYFKIRKATTINNNNNKKLGVCDITGGKTET